jgi:hypothetical protein
MRPLHLTVANVGISSGVALRLGKSRSEAQGKPQRPPSDLGARSLLKIISHTLPGEWKLIGVRVLAFSSLELQSVC